MDIEHSLKIILANIISLKYKAIAYHSIHFNKESARLRAEGIEEPFYEIFGSISTELDGALEPTTYWLNKYSQSEYTDLHIYRLTKLSTITPILRSSDFQDLAKDLSESLETVSKDVLDLYNYTCQTDLDLAGFLESRILQHKAHSVNLYQTFNIIRDGH